MTSECTTHDIAVEGGTLHVGVWPGAPGVRLIADEVRWALSLD